MIDTIFCILLVVAGCAVVALLVGFAVFVWKDIVDTW